MVAIRSDIFLLIGLALNIALVTACSTVDLEHQGSVESHMSDVAGRGTSTETKILDMDPDGCTWVTATGSVTFGDEDRTPSICPSDRGG